MPTNNSSTAIPKIALNTKKVTMKNRILLLILALLPFLHSSAQISRKKALADLDRMLERKSQQEEAKDKKLDSLKRVLYYTEESSRIELYRQIHQEYFQYQNDSALLYGIRLQELGVTQGDKEQSEYASNQIAICLGMMGAYLDCHHLLDSLRNTITTPEGLVRYYHTCRTTYGWEADFLAKIPRAGITYKEMTGCYRDSILLTDHDPVSLKVCEADNYLAQGKVQKAESALHGVEKYAQGSQKAYTHYILAMVCKAKGDTDNEIVHLAQTAMCDISMNKKEHTALLELANELYKQGDIDRSYRYLMHALEDAAFCNARLRSIEVARIYPIISLSYQRMQERNNLIQNVIYVTFSLLFLCITALAAYLYLQIKRVRAARRQVVEKNRQLEQANHMLEELNTSLAEADRVKLQYITIYLERCRANIESSNEVRKLLLKLALNGQYDALQKELRNITHINKEKQSFYNDFDAAFLNIYPHFVEKFNAILQPDSQLIPKKGEHLTTELRIFALIRLGITDTNKIAQFLDYSAPTIYQYRSRVRSTSILSKQEFDERILTL